MLDLLTEIEPAHAPSSAADHRAARALCHLTGLSTAPVLVQAAEHVLDVATHVLADPAHASVYASGGWAGSCRTYPQGTVHGTDPCRPPGAEQVTDLPEDALQRLGRLLQPILRHLAHRPRHRRPGRTRPPARLGARRRDPPHQSSGLEPQRGRRHASAQAAAARPRRHRTLTASTTGVYRVSLEALGDPPGQALGVQS